MNATTAHQQMAGGGGYGYQWWIGPNIGSYKAHGHFEQLIYVYPEYDIVAVFTGDVGDDEPHITDSLFERYILKAVDEYNSITTETKNQTSTTKTYDAAPMQYLLALSGACGIGFVAILIAVRRFTAGNQKS